METKKYKQKDLNRQSGLYFVLGLTLVLFLIYAALEWKSYDDLSKWDVSQDVDELLLEEVPITKHHMEQPKPKIQTPPIIEIAPDDEDIVETFIEANEPDQSTEVADISDIEVIDEPEDIGPVPFVTVENAPIYPGCENEQDEKAKKICFQKMIQKHINKVFRYPEMAQEMGIQGRVNTVFTIGKDGKIQNIQLRGPDKLLEEEARRIISKLPKMTPGKQRGNPVQVPFAIPITFKLQ